MAITTAIVRIRRLLDVQRALLDWHAANALQAPWRQSADPYEVLVAAVMAQQTQMSRVLPAYERFTAAFPTLESLAEASLAEVIRAWAGMGYNQRAVRLHRAAREITDGGWPRTAGELRRIHGVGPFTAAIIASFAFGQPSACVDTNVRRVLGRLAGDETIDGAPLQALADASMAAEQPARWNQALMDYGARVCGLRPKCEACVISAHCASRDRYLARAPSRKREATGAQRLTESKPALQPVADERAVYDAGPPVSTSPHARRPKKSEPAYEGSTRFFRGRIVDVLRGLAPGATLAIADLPPLIANGRVPPSLDETRAMAKALARHGLLALARDRVSLPDS